MSAVQEDPESRAPVERFRPTGGHLVGYVSLAVIVALLAYVAVGVHTLTGLRLATGLVFVGLLVWVTQLRPRATADPRALHLRNSLRDVTVPLQVIDGVSVRRMLNVRVGEERFVCIGIGAPLRRMVSPKTGGASSVLGWDRSGVYAESVTPPGQDRSAMRYQDFVATRIAGLVEEAKKRPPSGVDTRPERTWAWPEIVALAGTGAAFVFTLLL